jgi:Vitamin K-dependent gamma-carboxylase
MTLPLFSVLSVTERLTAFALLLQSVEWLQARAALSDSGVWQYALLAPEQRALPWPVRVLCAWTLPYRPFLWLLWLRCAAAVLSLGWGVSLVWPLLCLSQILVCIRFRGASNGGSDSLSVVLTSALSLPVLCGKTALTVQAALLYIAAQVTLSYVISGLVKLRQPDWRSGEALCHFILSSALGAPPAVARLVSHARAAQLLSWGAIGFECLFPLAWLSPGLCLGFLACGVGFHAANVGLFGLNRFFWAWIAGYPALFSCSQLVSVLYGT